MGKFESLFTGGIKDPNASVPLSQTSVDLGLRGWNPEMLDEKNPENSIMPAVGTGIRPKNMPKWVHLPPLREAYGERVQRLGVGGQAAAEPDITKPQTGIPNAPTSGLAGGGDLASALRELGNIQGANAAPAPAPKEDPNQRYFVNKNGRFPISEQTYVNMGGKAEDGD